MKFLAVLIAILGFGIQTQAQFKFGHIDSQKLLSVMPERDSAQKVLQKEADGLQEQAEIMQVEFNNKYQTYLEKAESLTELVRRAQEEELADMQERIKNFNTNAQQSLRQMESKLLQPIFDKVTSSIKTVGEENKFTYIYDIGSLLYFSSQSIDITDLVIDKIYSKATADTREQLKKKVKEPVAATNTQK